MARGVDIEGLPQLRAALLKAGDLAPDALAAAGYEEMEKVMTDAKEATPVDLNTLRDSGHVLPPEISSAGEVEIVAGFGGAASEYALAVHEHLSEHSPPSWQKAEGASQSVATGAFESNSDSGVTFSPVGTGPKFLERPFLERRKTMPRQLARGVERALRRLGT